MNFALFVVLNAILFIRPEELFPQIEGLRLYLVVISLCTFASLPGLANCLSRATWRSHPLTPFALVYLLLWVFSGIPYRGFGDVGSLFYQAFKNGLYYFLFLSTVDTYGRFKSLLGWFVAIVVVATALSVLTYHGYTNLVALEPYREGREDLETGEFVGTLRLKGSGICSDPNDFCQVILLGLICCLARASLARGWALAALWLLPTALFGYAITLTFSRGGLLGVLTGVGGVMFVRFGPRIGILLSPLVVVAGVLAAGGRQASFNMDDKNDTSQERIHLWAESFNLVFNQPLYFFTGVGTNTIRDECGLVAHNSFVQAYAETGLIGGTLFSCLILLPLLAICSFRPPRRPKEASRDTDELFRLRSYVFGILAGFAAGCYSLTRNGTESTYVFLGLGACYLALARDVSPRWFRLDPAFLKRSAALGVVVLVVLKVFTQVMARY